MNQNDFRLFKEIKVHLEEVHSLNKQINEEQSRIDFIENQISSKENQLETSQSNLSELHETIGKKEKELFDIEKKLETSKSHLSMAHNQKEAEALEHESENLGGAAEALQEELLSLMEDEEILKDEIEKAETFISGSKKSLIEITNEVNLSIEQLQNEINSHDTEWKDHAKQISDGNKAIFKNSWMKFKESSPFTDLNGQGCRTCGYSLDSTLHRAVTNQTSLEICPGCNRIFLI